MLSHKVVTITKEQVSALPLLTYTGRAHVVDDMSLVLPAVDFLRKQRVVGFDTETRPSFKRGRGNKTALMQLATDTDCFLFRLCRIGMPAALRRYLEDERCLKVGLSVHDDFYVLRRRCADIKPAAFIDLQQLVANYGIVDVSLQKIYAILFGKRISKSQRLSNWEADELKPAQCHYAALDAKACVDIYDYLTAGLFEPQLSPYYVDVAEQEQTSNDQS